MKILFKKSVSMNSLVLKEDFYIIISAYPKSGITWFTTLIGDTLRISKRDIYITPQNIIFHKNDYLNIEIYKHPWYLNEKSVAFSPPCVIKSHELPNSNLIQFENARHIHLLRDGRDVIVSKYFYEKDFSVQNGLIKSFDTPFDTYVKNIALEWKNFVKTWFHSGTPIIKYENLLESTKEVLVKTLEILNINAVYKKIDEAIEDNTKNRFSKKLDNICKSNTFVRKGVSGDWKNYFTEDNKNTFKEAAGDLLVELGYEKNNSW